MKVKKGDEVVVIAGKDRGAKGKVIEALPEQNRVIVEGVNRIKKHTKITTGARGAKQGGIETVEAAISARTAPRLRRTRKLTTGEARRRRDT